MPFKDPNTNAPTATPATVQPASVKQEVNKPDTLNQGVTTIPEVTIKGDPARGRGGQPKDAHPYSEDVKKMQNALLTVASELNIRHGQDNPNPELTKKLQDISKHVVGQGTGYGDGLWGNNTQEGLNGLYDFISDLTKRMTGEVKQKYETLLKQMESAGVGPGKQYNQIEAKNVSQYAKTLYGNIRTIIDNWNDDIEKAMSAKPAPAQEPAAGGPTAGTAPAGGTGGEGQQTAQQPGQQSVIPAGYKEPQQDANQNQPGQAGQTQPATPGQGGSGVGQGQQGAAPQGAGVGLSVYPFDLDGDIISMQQFQQFLTQVFSLQNVGAFRKALGPYIEALNGQASAATQSVNNWMQEARANQSIDGFSLALGADTDALVEANFNHNYVTARNMLNMLSELCSRLSYIVEMLRRSKMFDDVALREQAQRGGDYIKRIGVMVDKIESKLRSGQNPANVPYGSR